MSGSPPGLAGASTWTRIGRRAGGARERDQLALLRDLASAATPLLSADAAIDPIAGRATLRLALPGLAVGMSGVQDLAAARALQESVADLRGAGRYGALWWLELRGSSRLVILGSRLWLSAGRGGSELLSPVPGAGDLCSGPVGR